jgi:CelD/BcsL family acetyltransferase involved in cellulose biosynthesis
VAARGDKVCGLLALSRIDEAGCFGHFPGELWQGRTWLEQNKIVAADQRVARALIAHLPWETRIRYLVPDDHLHLDPQAAVDETGYLFFPRQFDYRFEAYQRSFAGKTRRKIRSELDRLNARGVAYRFDHWADMDALFNLNLDRYQDQSYFSDRRFQRAMESLAIWLRDQGLLRLTTVLVGGRVAAVDMGAVWNGTYTVMAGGTHPDFPGIAKLINFHHLEWACAQRIQMVDFLCGDFNWKDRFHLTARPLYTIEKTRTKASWSRSPALHGRAAACAA